MRLPIIRASDTVNSSGVEISKRSKEYIRRFREAFDLDAQESEIANKVYEIHCELNGDYDTYIEVCDVLGPTLKRALHTYVSMKWRER